ncbi:MAG: hypothetical protein ACI8TQ_000543 [Planctomycetota bacterium]|jgi:uncharacterized protein YjbK
MINQNNTEGREVEFKLSVRGEDDFSRLISMLGSESDTDSFSLQENHFFDTEHRTLRAYGLSLRLRFEENRRLLTVKGPVERSFDGLIERAEEEIEIDPVTAERILAGVESPFGVILDGVSDASIPIVETARTALVGQTLECVGSFRNIRRYFGPVDVNGVDLTFEMDRTEFPGGRIDHEVEIEVESEQEEQCRESLRQLFQRADIPWQKAQNKAQRFFEALALQTPDEY